MELIYKYENVEKSNKDKKTLLEVKKELNNLYECIGGEIIKENFNISDFGVIILIDDIEEVESILENKSCLNNTYKNLKVLYVEQWIILNDIYYWIKLADDMDNLIEIIVEDEMYRKQSMNIKNLIQKNLKVIKNNKDKQILKC